MCYNIRYMTEKLEKYAKRYGNKDDWESIQQKLEFPAFQKSGFSHPQVPIITGKDDDRVQLFTWGFIPSWTKDLKTASVFQKKTLNTRGETMKDNKLTRSSVSSRRCLIIIDGFFEHHTHGKEKIPFHIYHSDYEPMTIAGLWNSWSHDDQQFDTFSLITCNANPMMARIHNQPAASETHRMPLIIDEPDHQQWLHGSTDEIEELIKPYDQDKLRAHTVPKLSGKKSPGNRAEAVVEFEYEGFEMEVI